MLFVLDDFHCADEPTAALLRHLLRVQARGPLAVLVLARNPEHHNVPHVALALESAERQCPTERLTLTGLDTAAVARVVRGVAAQAADSRLRRGAGRAHGRQPAVRGGDPARARGLARCSTDRVPDAADLARVSVPRRVQAVLGRRLERLGPAPNDVLADAAALGLEFRLRVLEELAGPGGDPLSAIELALDSGLVVERALPGRFAFSHAMVRDAVYARRSRARRARTHARIAHLLATNADLDATLGRPGPALERGRRVGPGRRGVRRRRSRRRGRGRVRRVAALLRAGAHPLQRGGHAADRGGGRRRGRGRGRPLVGPAAGRGRTGAARAGGAPARRPRRARDAAARAAGPLLVGGGGVGGVAHGLRAGAAAPTRPAAVRRLRARAGRAGRRADAAGALRRVPGLRHPGTGRGPRRRRAPDRGPRAQHARCRPGAHRALRRRAATSCSRRWRSRSTSRASRTNAARTATSRELFTRAGQTVEAAEIGETGYRLRSAATGWRAARRRSWPPTLSPRSRCSAAGSERRSWRRRASSEGLAAGDCAYLQIICGELWVLRGEAERARVELETAQAIVNASFELAMASH